MRVKSTSLIACSKEKASSPKNGGKKVLFSPHLCLSLLLTFALSLSLVEILQSLQWRPLRVNALEDIVAGENQPNRVIFSDDLKISEFVMLSSNQLGRERFVELTSLSPSSLISLCEG
jgi:hypothetical protein